MEFGTRSIIEENDGRDSWSALSVSVFSITSHQPVHYHRPFPPFLCRFCLFLICTLESTCFYMLFLFSLRQSHSHCKCVWSSFVRVIKHLEDVTFHMVEVCYCDWSCEHSKDLTTGIALMTAILCLQMCLLKHTYPFLLLPWLLFPSSYPSGQCFKGICSLLVNVIKGRWSVMLIVRLLSHLTGNSPSCYHGRVLFLFQSRIRDFIFLSAQLN